MNPPEPSRAVAWLVVASLLAAGAVLALPWSANTLDWQPTLAARQPWRAWTGAWVHWSHQHLWANLAGTLVVAALGWAARLPTAAALAWAAAWPLTQLGLLTRLELTHFGGLSGVLHAGVAVAAVWLVWPEGGGLSRLPRVPRLPRMPRMTRMTRQRWVGCGLLAGLIVKLLTESPWGPALRHSAQWDIATAPLAHTTGAIAGGVCAAVALAWQHTQAPRTGRRPRP